MKVSVNWVRQFTDVNLPVDELVKKIGAQLGAVEEVIDLGKKYQGIVVARVVSCEKHPNADKLSVCKLDDGGKVQGVDRDENGHVQVVCGAPNVREGLTVAWLPPGATVPTTFDKDPFVLEKRELRGVMSNGMIASASELAIGDDHNGIAELDTPADPGTDFAEAYELNDYIIDIENKMFTHRPDCFGILGVAREIAGIQGTPFKSPDWCEKPLGRIKPGKSKLPLEVKNEAGDLVPRFMAVAMAEVRMGQSPFIIQTYLARVGLKPINNIVDVTNYLMVLTGQPLHAYDYDKVKERSVDVPTLIARRAGNKEKIKLLNGKEIAFDDPAVLIATDKEPIGVGGVMGGADTEVDENTKNIILECANFDMYSIRKTAMKYGLFTDAVTRFNKGQSPLQNEIVLEEAVETIQYVSGAHVASDTFDLQQKLPERHSVVTTSEFVNSRLGLNLPVEDMIRLLENVEFKVTVSGNEFISTPPYWRTDIEISEDIVEEVGRLYGFDHLPIELPKRPIKPARRDKMFSLKSRIREVLSSAGANEVLTYSFVHGNLLEKVGQDKNLAFQLSNALSPDLQYYRLSLSPSLLEKVHPNIKAGYDEFAVFEIGKKHQKGFTDKENLPNESNVLALVVAAKDKPRQNKHGAAFYQARKYLDQLLGPAAQKVRYANLHEYNKDNQKLPEWLKPFEPSRTAMILIDEGAIGAVGEYRADVRKALKLPVHSAGFEIGLFYLEGLLGRSAYTPLSRFPKVQQDISLRTSKNITYQPLFDELLAGLAELSGEGLRTELVPLDIYQKDEFKHFTFRLTAVHYEKTLKSTEINELLEKLAERAKEKFHAERL